MAAVAELCSNAPVAQMVKREVREVNREVKREEKREEKREVTPTRVR